MSQHYYEKVNMLQKYIDKQKIIIFIWAWQQPVTHSESE